MEDIYYPVAHRTQEEIDALKLRYKTFDEQLIPDIFRKAIGVTARSWRKPMTWGTSHVVYEVTVEKQQDPLILRANIGWGEPEAALVIEKLITDTITKLGIPVNTILVADISRSMFPFEYQIQKKLKGKDIEDTFRGSQDDYDALSFQLGTYIAGWGSVSFQKFGRFDTSDALHGTLSGTKDSMYDYLIVQLDNDIAYLVDAKILTIRTADRVRKLFEEYKAVMNIEKGTLVHYDLADHNIMFDELSNTITGIFDWEAAVVGDPALDLASCPTWKTQYPREEKLLEGYMSIRALPEHFGEKKNIYRLRTMLWKMVYAIRTGILNEDRKKKFVASLAPFGLNK